MPHPVAREWIMDLFLWSWDTYAVTVWRLTKLGVYCVLLHNPGSQCHMSYRLQTRLVMGWNDSSLRRKSPSETPSACSCQPEAIAVSEVSSPRHQVLAYGPYTVIFRWRAVSSPSYTRICPKLSELKLWLLLKSIRKSGVSIQNTYATIADSPQEVGPIFLHSAVLREVSSVEPETPK